MALNRRIAQIAGRRIFRSRPFQDSARCASSGRGRSLRPHARVSARLSDSRLVPRRQVRHLGALGSAVGHRRWRLVRPQHVHAGLRPVQLPVETYGHPSKVGYKDLVNNWKAAKWDPDT